MSEEAKPPTFARAFTSLSLASGVSMGANLVRGKLAALFLARPVSGYSTSCR